MECELSGGLRRERDVRAGASVRTPTWTAPANLTGTAQGCTLTVTVGDGFAASATQGFTETVNPAPNTVTITAAPTGTPNPVVFCRGGGAERDGE